MTPKSFKTAGTSCQMVADVLLLLPLAKTYSYLIPKELEGQVSEGIQVRCSVRGRPVDGLVLNVRPPLPDDPVLIPLTGINPRTPWPKDLLELLSWTARYYVAPLGVVAKTAMPTVFAKRAPKKDRFVRFVKDPQRTPKSDRTVTVIKAIKAAGAIEISEARALVEGGGDIVRRLLASGVLEIEERDALGPGPVKFPKLASPLILNEHQSKALDHILAAIGKGYSGFLLHGVTGSGKTEVYLRAIEATLKMGQGAIILVPEIALTIELRQRFQERFGDHVAILHSAMPESRRAAAWDKVLAGQTKVVVGARSAVFAPVSNLGLIVVDEEHETTYKQSDGLRYNARDLALVRGTIAKCPVVLGSATPSLESFQNAHDKKLMYLGLPNRVQARPLPEVTFVDLRYSESVSGERLFSLVLRDALRQTIDRGESAILFLNRRGFGRFIVCKTCGTAIQCPNCSITLTHHMRPEKLTCHYCDYSSPVLQECPTCQAKELSIIGFGTERVEEEIANLIPGARCARLDSDTATGGGLDKILTGFRNGDTNILIGTQIVAKGHDFPKVTLVGVLFAEQSLAFPDFRASERTFQLLTQVAGRAGRGQSPGQVIIQTFKPEQYALRFASAHDFLGFAVVENKLRKERGYPPHAFLAAIEVSSPDAVEAKQEAMRIKSYLAQFGTTEGPDGRNIMVLGPSMAAIQRLRGRTRLHILLKGPKRSTINSVLWKLYRLVGNGHGQVRISIDVDPQTLL
ncbi:MAG TPA: primosomal protein N' [Myxococcota bacterium]|nr:primosomal protein N' [Myxococcota bacterium]